MESGHLDFKQGNGIEKGCYEKENTCILKGLFYWPFPKFLFTLEKVRWFESPDYKNGNSGENKKPGIVETGMELFSSTFPK